MLKWLPLPLPSPCARASFIVKFQATIVATVAPPVRLMKVLRVRSLPSPPPDELLDSNAWFSWAGRMRN